MKSVLKVDGVAYPGLHVSSLRRSFQVSDGQNAGRVMSLDMVRDVGGTFYNYTISIDPDGSSLSEYDSFYEVISAPVDYHMLEVPYGQSILTFKAYITNGEDELLSMFEDANIWGGLSINFIAMSPQRRPTE